MTTPLPMRAPNARSQNFLTPLTGKRDATNRELIHSHSARLTTEAPGLYQSLLNEASAVFGRSSIAAKYTHFALYFTACIFGAALYLAD